MKKFKATCEVIDYKTDKTISERVIGRFDTEQEASTAAWSARLEGETVCIHSPYPIEDEEEDISALEMAEVEVAWNEIRGYR